VVLAIVIKLAVENHVKLHKEGGMIKWLYKQSTGELYKDGALIAIGYSGVLTNKNNPDREQVRGMGPIPRGIWRIGI